jgi:hypothetical protein
MSYLAFSKKLMKTVLSLFFVLVFFSFQTLGQPTLRTCRNGDLWGFCDPEGNVVIPQVFQKVHNFQGNLGPVVREDSYWWMINKKGIFCFNSRRWADQYPPEPVKGLYKIAYFDPIFANVTEYYNKNGLPVKVEDESKISGDTIEYKIFNFQEALTLAQSKLGTPYGENKLDCSGFIRFIFQPFGIVLPYYASEIAEKGREIALKEAKPGDLIFFGGAGENDKNPNHVGMIISVKGKEIEFIHSSSSKGVIQNKNTEPYFKKRFLFVRRIFG